MTKTTSDSSIAHVAIGAGAQSSFHNTRWIAKDLLAGCPDDAYEDHLAIAAAVISGKSPESVLLTPEVARWPETYAWLKASTRETPDGLVWYY